MEYHFSYLVLDVFWFITVFYLSKFFTLITIDFSGLEGFKVRILVTYIVTIYILHIGISSAFGFSFFYLRYFFQIYSNKNSPLE